jgi:hypothetical protein
MKPSGYFIHYHVLHLKIPLPAYGEHVCICMSFIRHSDHFLTLNSLIGFVTQIGCVYCVVRTETLSFMLLIP